MNTLGAHEVLELHEVLNDAIHGLNTLKLYRQHAKEPQLQAMMDRHMSALTLEYNTMVQMAHQSGASQAIPIRRMNSNINTAPLNRTFQPTYGLQNQQNQTTVESPQEIDDVDVSICIINCHKQTAALKMNATLEMANPNLRRMMQLASISSADMAYEGFQYANHKGYYQVPTLKDTTAHNFMQTYGPANIPQMGHLM